jgi:hypothetical protein
LLESAIHLAPNAPWWWLALLSVGVLFLGSWAYAFGVPPVSALMRRALSAARILSLLLLLWLLAQPVWVRSGGGGGTRIVALVDHSGSMDLPAAPGGAPRGQAAEVAIEALRAGLRGRATLDVVPFANGLDPDSGAAGREATAIGDALTALARTEIGRQASGVIVVSDGTVNAGADPVRAAQVLGVPVHAVIVGAAGAADRAVAGIDASASARVGEATPIRVRITSTEPRGTPLGVRLMDGVREIARATVPAPGDGAEATADLRVTPTRPGLAVWSAEVDSLPGEISGANNARQVAIEVAPGRLGVMIVTGGLNWDLAFVRRALMADSGLRVTTWSRERGGWRVIGDARGASPPGAADLARQSVVILDAIAASEVDASFDAALARHVRNGGGLMLLGGPLPGVSRFRAGALGADLEFQLSAGAIARSAAPSPDPGARELVAWDEDPARGERAWRAAAPLSDLVPLAPGAGDRVLIGSLGEGPPLVLVRRIGRGQAMIVNGTGLWRWSMSPNDDLSAVRGERLWRRFARRLAEPVQGEPLRVRPERWLSAGGETVRLFATLQDAQFRPVAGASVGGELRGPSGLVRPLTFLPRAAGSYVAELHGLPPGRYNVDVRATTGGRDAGRAAAAFAVDRWSLEAARTHADSATMAAMAAAAGGEAVPVARAAEWARGIAPAKLARQRTVSTRLWESPWIFGIVVGLLAFEWATRRRRGLP